MYYKVFLIPNLYYSMNNPPGSRSLKAVVVLFDKKRYEKWS